MVPSHDRGENQVALRVSGMSMGKEMLMPRDKLAWLMLYLLTRQTGKGAAFLP